MIYVFLNIITIPVYLKVPLVSRLRCYREVTFKVNHIEQSFLSLVPEAAAAAAYPGNSLVLISPQLLYLGLFFSRSCSTAWRHFPFHSQLDQSWGKYTTANSEVWAASGLGEWSGHNVKETKEVKDRKKSKVQMIETEKNMGVGWLCTLLGRG